VSSWKEDPTNKVWEAEIDKYIEAVYVLRNRIDELEQENAALWLVIEDAKPVMRDYAMHNPPWTDGFGPTQDPNGVHAWLAHNDAVMEKKHD
jgi:hypothetical protein